MAIAKAWGYKITKRKNVSKSSLCEFGNFLSISQNQTKFLPSVCLAFSDIPVSLSAVSLRRLSTYVLLDFKVAKWAVSSLTQSSNPFQVNIAKNSKCTGREKTSEKRNF